MQTCSDKIIYTSKRLELKKKRELDQWCCFTCGHVTRSDIHERQRCSGWQTEVSVKWKEPHPGCGMIPCMRNLGQDMSLRVYSITQLFLKKTGNRREGH